MKFIHDNLEIEFTVKYRSRKTFEIKVEPQGTVSLIAPKGVREEDIVKIVKSKGKWIKDKVLAFREIQYRKKEYVNDEVFLYLGETYPLEIIVNEACKKSKTRLDRGKFYITTNTMDEETLKASMEEWYRKMTLEKVIERIAYFQKYFSVKPNTVKVKDQKKRWGSCSSKRNLNFNLRCSMAPHDVIDYIVVHEMCHLVHMNHSKEFWKLVENIIPDYKMKRKWLKDHGMKMDI